MTDDDVLLAAVRADPDSDLPRLVYAYCTAGEMSHGAQLPAGEELAT